MPRPKKQPTNVVQHDLLDLSDTLRTAPCVPAIRQEVKQWQANGYPGITPTTRRLLAWWFKNDHRTRQGAKFHYYRAQQDAIETLIYLFEVKKIRRRGDLLSLSPIELGQALYEAWGVLALQAMPEKLKFLGLDPDDYDAARVPAWMRPGVLRHRQLRTFLRETEEEFGIQLAG